MKKSHLFYLQLHILWLWMNCACYQFSCRGSPQCWHVYCSIRPKMDCMCIEQSTSIICIKFCHGPLAEWVLIHYKKDSITTGKILYITLKYSTASSFSILSILPFTIT
jgi:hypothetical protein